MLVRTFIYAVLQQLLIKQVLSSGLWGERDKRPSPTCTGDTEAHSLALHRMPFITYPPAVRSSHLASPGSSLQPGSRMDGGFPGRCNPRATSGARLGREGSGEAVRRCVFLTGPSLTQEVTSSKWPCGAIAPQTGCWESGSCLSLG